MKRKTLVVFLFVAFALPLPATHPFYLSIAEIDYNSQNKTFEVSLKLFTDNLESGLEKAFPDKFQPGQPISATDKDQLVAAYLKDKFSVSVNGKPVEFTFLGQEVLPDVTWCYLEGKNISSVQKVRVKNLLLLEVFDSQKNIVHIDISGRKKSLLLQRGNTEEEVLF
ncbi:MAG: DUF6702 family protein [Bacteroidia bacterium]